MEGSDSYGEGGMFGLVFQLVALNRRSMELTQRLLEILQTSWRGSWAVPPRIPWSLRRRTINFSLNNRVSKSLSSLFSLKAIVTSPHGIVAISYWVSSDAGQDCPPYSLHVSRRYLLSVCALYPVSLLHCGLSWYTSASCLILYFTDSSDPWVMCVCDSCRQWYYGPDCPRYR